MSGWVLDNPVEITDWTIVVEQSDGFRAPELLKRRLHGLRVHDGKYITTSHIVKYKKEDNLVVTSSGTHYKLGKMNDAYAEWLKEHKV